MSTRFTSGKVGFELGASRSPAPQKADDETPFRLAVLGDFSGRGRRPSDPPAPLANRQPILVDVDNLDALPGRLGAAAQVPVGNEDGVSVAVALHELEDFHPDRIFERLELFQALKDIRKRLQDPTTFDAAAAQLRSQAPDQPAAAEASPETPAEPDADTLQRLLGTSPSTSRPADQRQGSVDVEALIRRAVQPYVVPAPHPQQADLVAQVDRAISGQMSAILHCEGFQALEATWQALQLLVSRVETDETLELYIVDVTKAELAADLAKAENPESAAMYRLFVEQSLHVPGGLPWTLLVGCYRFDQTGQDLALLRQIGGIAKAAGAPFVAQADPHFAGCESIAATPDPNDWRWQATAEAAEAWGQLRRSAQAPFVGLALPRFLLRLPYGKDTEPIDRFDFEELADPADHERYLWGNPAWICACLLAEAFSRHGWSLTEGLARDMTDLPMHVRKADGQTHVTPCAEVMLTERAMQALIEKGLMPLLSIKGRNAARLARFQSVSEPATPLAGRWR